MSARAQGDARGRLAILASHPIQYYAPLFRELARHLDIHVFFAHKTTPQQQAAAGFGSAFEWDIDLTSGYPHSFLTNISARPGTGHYSGCDTPEIGARLKEGDFDAVLVFGWYLKSSIQATLAARRLGLPVMVRGDSQLGTARSPLKRAIKALVYPLFLRLFDAALFVGNRSRAYYEHYRYPAARLFSSPHCIDTEWFSQRATAQARQILRDEMGVDDEEKIVLFAGKLLPFKRPLDVVEACAQLACEGYPVRMVVAGSGELEAVLRERAGALGVKLDLLGFQNQTKMPAAYAAADVLMLPSDSRETWGLVANEALACGLPVVVADSVGCAEDLAEDGQAGRVFPLADISSAVTALREVLVSPPAAQDIAEKSARYSIAAAAQGVVEAFDYLTKRRRAVNP